MGAARKRIAIPVDRDPNRTFPERLGRGPPERRSPLPAAPICEAGRGDARAADASCEPRPSPGDSGLAMDLDSTPSVPGADARPDHDEPARPDAAPTAPSPPAIGTGPTPAPVAVAPSPSPSPAALDAHFDSVLPATAVDCRLRITPGAMMYSAILAGLAGLARDGRIRLELELVPYATPLDHGPWAVRDKDRPQPVLEVEGGGRAVLDAHDGAELEPQDLQDHDLYFKRSLRPEALLLPGGERLRPLGLLNDVRNDFLDRHELASELATAGSSLARGRALLRWLAWQGAARLGLGGRPNLARMHAAPVPGQPQRVLMMARLWDPADVPAEEPAERAAREILNQQRIDCIRALRRAFGARFHGGLYPDAFAQRVAPDLLLPSPRAASRREFLRQVRRHAVCVTSAGLRGSIGFRMAEFVAFSRAIVTEPLPHALPGDFAPGRNYLEYRTPDQCVARVAQLFDRADLRDRMAQRNWSYYTDWMRPERLALRLVALTRAARADGATPPAAPRI